VGFEQIVFDLEDFGDVFGGEFVGECGYAFADDSGADRAGSVRRNLLGGRQSFKAGIVPLALAEFGDDEDFHGQITRASNLSFSTSLVATSFGVPVRNSVFLVFVGT